MNIVYFHGFLGTMKIRSEKVEILSQLGPVSGPEIPYSDLPDQLEKRLVADVIQRQADLIVGTSMGGFYAAAVGTKTGIPFVAINPAIEPAKTLRKYLDGSSPFNITPELLAAYPAFNTSGCGLILLDDGDEVIDSNKTEMLLEPHYGIVRFPDGSHRFEHMLESLTPIREFFRSQKRTFIPKF